MTRKREISIHAGFWLMFFGLNFLFDFMSLENKSIDLWTALQIIGFALLQIVIFYSNYCVICPGTVPQKRWVLLVFGQLLLIILFALFRHVIEEVVIFKITGVHNYTEESRLTLYYVYDNTFYSVRIILLSLVFYFVKTIWNTNQKMNELTIQKKQVELQNLKNQLSPHFMFNTLNSFYADLMDVQPQIANDILKLSEMLRYITYENESDTVLLKDEILFIQNYIALFSRRYDNRPAVVFRADGVDDETQIPSLLLIHFVENALKHGAAMDAEKPVKIQLKKEEDRLNFLVENYFITGQHYDEPGIGYKNIRQRLELLFPQKHTLHIRQTQDFYSVELQIPVTKCTQI
jgi:two-component system LytT family sensor kinase